MLKLEKLKLKFKNLKLRNWNLKTKRAKISLVVVALVALVVIFNWQRFSAFAQSVVDTFTSTDRVAGQWNVAVDTGTGEVKLAEKTCDDGQWFCNENTVCPNMMGDGDFIVVNRTDTPLTKQWKLEDTNCDTPECAQDGGQLGDNLVTDNTVNFASYPARETCKGLGGRLPTQVELACIYNNRTTFGNNFASAYYWSSTEESGTSAKGVYFLNGNTTGLYKTTARSVRCVRGW